MARESYVWHSGNWVLRSEYARTRSHFARSDLPSPMLILDTMQGAQSMLDGRVYDSKSELRKLYKREGVIEVGNEPLRPPAPVVPDRKAIQADVYAAINKVENGYRPSEQYGAQD